MQKILDITTIKKIINHYGIETIFKKIINQLESDYANWENFNIIPRPAFHSKDGVIELMPISNQKFFAFKCVNGHPNNPNQKKLTVIAIGQLNEMQSGYPLLITEMTLLTAIRTAANAALAAKYLAQKKASKLALIGCGAQAEFQIIAHCLLFNITTINYFDIDAQAMSKLVKNMSTKYPKINFISCDSIQKAIQGSDIIIIATASKNKAKIIDQEWLESGMHISALGGDCPGKTELDINVLKKANKVVVEFFDQSFIEGEIQQFSHQKAQEITYCQINQLCNKQKIGRENDEEITIFDSVGIALQDYSTLLVFYELVNKTTLGINKMMVPKLDNPKDLYGYLMPKTIKQKIINYSIAQQNPFQIANAIKNICKQNHKFNTITPNSCICTTGVWSGVWKHYGEFGLVYISEVINNSILALLGEKVQEYLLYNQVGKINGANLIVVGLCEQRVQEQKYLPREKILVQHGVQIHYKSQVAKLGIDKILNQALLQFKTKNIPWGISSDISNETYAKKYLKEFNFIGCETRKKLNK